MNRKKTRPNPPRKSEPRKPDPRKPEPRKFSNPRSSVTGEFKPAAAAGCGGIAAKATLALVACPLVLWGCTAPPSVLPLLAATRKGLEHEARQVEADAARDDRYFQQMRAGLAEGFDADMEAQDTLTTDWVREAMAGYIPARETLVRQEMNQQHRRAIRAENLRALGEAQQRAAQVLARQDDLLLRTLRLDLWGLLRDERR